MRVPLTSSYRWVVMGLWVVTSVSGFMVMSTFGVLLPAISADLQLSPSQQGIVGSAGFWGNVALALPLSWLASRFSPKKLTTATLLVGTLFLGLQGWASGFLVLLIGRLAFGIAIVASQPARAILTQQWFPPAEFVMVNSVSNALFGVVVGGGLVATPLILVALGDNWRGTIYTFVAFLVALTVLWMIFGRERKTVDPQRQGVVSEVSVLKRALTYRDLWVQGLGFLGPTMTWSAFLSFFPTMVLERDSIPLQWSGGILAVGIVVGGASGLMFGHLSTNPRRGKAILQSLGLLMVGTFLGMTLTSSIPLLFILSFLNGVAWGFWPILFTVPFYLPGIRPREVAVALAFTMMITSSGTALGSLVTGFLQEALGDLRLSLFLISFAAVTLSITGAVLRTVTQGASVERSVESMEA